MIGTVPGKNPTQNLWRINFKGLGDGEQLAARRRHLTRAALDHHKIILLINWWLAPPNLFDNFFARIVGTTLAGMIFTTRLEINFFKGPTHRPIRPPIEL